MVAVDVNVSWSTTAVAMVVAAAVFILCHSQAYSIVASW